MQAAISRDTEKFAALLHPDYRTVNEDGSSMDTVGTLAEMRGPTPLEIPALPPPSELLIRVLGDTALVSARQQVFTLDIRCVEVWVRAAGDWRLAHWHATRVTPEGAAREARARAEVAR